MVLPFKTLALTKQCTLGKSLEKIKGTKKYKKVVFEETNIEDKSFNALFLGHIAPKNPQH